MENHGAIACDKCGSEGLAVRTLREHRTDALGLPGVTLLGIARELCCTNCGQHLGVSYPNLEGIIAALALARSEAPQKLHGAEVLFMRKALGWTARELASRLGVREETVSRWEHDHEPIGPASEKLLRLMVVELLSSEAPAMRPDRRKILIGMKTKPSIPERAVQFRLKSVELRKGRRRQRAYALA